MGKSRLPCQNDPRERTLYRLPQPTDISESSGSNLRPQFIFAFIETVMAGKSKPELQAELRKRKVKTSGTKADLQMRLVESNTHGKFHNFHARYHLLMLARCGGER